MTKLLEQALDAVRRMPPADQDTIAQAMLSMVQLDGDVIDDVDLDELREAMEGLAQVDRGEIATNEELEAAFRRFRP